MPTSEPKIDHGYSVARWVGSIISFVGFLAGGIALIVNNKPVVVAGGALQVVALVAVVALNAAGFGYPDVWGELKAKAAAERQKV